MIVFHVAGGLTFVYTTWLNTIADVAVTARSLLSGILATRFHEGDAFNNIRAMIPERFASRKDSEDLVLNCARGGYLHLREVSGVGPGSRPGGHHPRRIA